MGVKIRCWNSNLKKKECKRKWEAEPLLTDLEGLVGKGEGCFPHLPACCSRLGRIDPCLGHYQGTALLIRVGEGQPKKSRQCPPSSGGEWCVEPITALPRPPHAVCTPALVLGRGPALPPPSPSLTLPLPEMQSHCLFLCPASFSPGGEHSWWQMDGQTDRWVSRDWAGAGSLPVGVWTLQKSKSSTAVSEK